jgi:anti-sigma B factor antagonist
MHKDGFEANVRHEAGVATLDMSGEIDRAADDGLSRAYADAAETGASSVILNFTDVDYINSTGIAVIVGVMGRARQEGRTISAYGLTDHYKQLFDITRLSEYMHIYDDESTALAGVGAGA